MTATEKFIIWNDQKIYTVYHHPTQILKGVVILVHGYGEHSGRYTPHLVPFLGSLGFAVYRYDNIGHGKSEGQRGYCKDYESLLDLLEENLTFAAQLHPEVPVFLYGHSMGGNLVLNLALRRTLKVSGIIATSPYLRLAFTPPAWKLTIGKILQKVVPRLSMPAGIDPKGISSIPAEVNRYREDPLVHDRITPNYAFPVLEAGEWAIENANKTSVPSLIVHSRLDPIIDHKGSIEFDRLADRNRLVLLEEGFHELHHDVSRDTLFYTIQLWLTENRLL